MTWVLGMWCLVVGRGGEYRPGRTSERLGGMALSEPHFTIGIEEEYLLVDRETRDLVNEPPESMMEECQSPAKPTFMSTRPRPGSAAPCP